MAERRMFARSVIGSARFLKMPATARLLYYDLGMSADDDGIVEAFSVMRTTGSSEDDLRVLASKGFVRVLNEDFVSYILDWEKNNLIRKDRYHPSIYADIKDAECNVLIEPEQAPLPNGQPMVNQRLTEDRLGKGSIGKENTNTSDSDELFECFWKAYPKKVGKGAVKKAWAKLKPSSQLVEKMLASLSVQRQSAQWTKDNGQYIPNPLTWLNQERWEDELKGGTESVGTNDLGYTITCGQHL